MAAIRVASIPPNIRCVFDLSPLIVYSIGSVVNSPAHNATLAEPPTIRADPLQCIVEVVL